MNHAVVDADVTEIATVIPRATKDLPEAAVRAVVMAKVTTIGRNDGPASRPGWKPSNCWSTPTLKTTRNPKVEAADAEADAATDLRGWFSIARFCPKILDSLPAGGDPCDCES